MGQECLHRLKWLGLSPPLSLVWLEGKAFDMQISALSVLCSVMQHANHHNLRGMKVPTIICRSKHSQHQHRLELTCMAHATTGPCHKPVLLSQCSSGATNECC